MADDMTSTMQKLVHAKAKELFALCDKEEKGFIIKIDMQRLRDELGVEPEQLEDVFDSLDVDHNGCLTLQEFTSGFGVFIGNQINTAHENEAQLIDTSRNDNEDERAFHDTLLTLGAKDLYDDEETIMGLWIKLRETDPILLGQFEQFISKVTEEIKRSKSDHGSIEAALQSKSSIYDDEIKKLYEEMEQQIKMEKDEVLEEVKIKEREIREQMNEELRVKEQQLADVMKKQNDLETKLLHINLSNTEMKSDNERLEKEKIELEEQLEETKKILEGSKDYVSLLQLQIKNEKQVRAEQTLKFTENLAIERENLVQELDELKDKYTLLVDELDLRQDTNLQEHGLHLSIKAEDRKGSILSNYFSSPFTDNNEPEEDDDTSNMLNNHEAESFNGSTKNQNHLNNQNLVKRYQPIGAHAVIHHSELMNVASNATPDRIFKVAFVGDSGVGKTSFIHRFCRENFADTFSTTVGVDLQVKMLNIDNRIIALQLWDTVIEDAGQERFRSITKQYVRKSDGIILVYDVTSEITFKNVRSWMSSIQESIHDDCAIVLVGNKIDLCDDDEHQPVKCKDGTRLATEYRCLFFESSARIGTSVIEIMEAITRVMQEKDDKLRKGDTVVNLSSKAKKIVCC